MANFVDTSINVKKIDNDGLISVEIGPEGFTWDIADLINIQNGADAQFLIKMNVALSLKLAGVDMTDEIKIKEHIEKKTFKYFR